MANKFEPGSLFKIPVGDDDFAYGVMLGESPFVAFYDKEVMFDEIGASQPPVFVVAVAHVAWTRGSWGKPVRKLPIGTLHAIPRLFWQNQFNKNDCKIIEPDGRRVPVKPADCIGLEKEAVWHHVHIESRLADTYAGRPNSLAESHRVKI